MSDYHLTIKIHSYDRDLLDDLVVTLESVNNNLQGISHVDVLLSDAVQTEQMPAPPYTAAQSCYQTEILERWIAGVEGLDY